MFKFLIVWDPCCSLSITSLVHRSCFCLLHAATASEKLKVKTSKISLSKGFLELQKVDLTWWQTPSLVEVQLSVFLKHLMENCYHSISGSVVPLAMFVKYGPPSYITLHCNDSTVLFFSWVKVLTCGARPGGVQPGLLSRHGRVSWECRRVCPRFSSPKTPSRTVLDLVWWQNAHLVAPCLTLGGHHCHQGWGKFGWVVVLRSREGPLK